MPVNIIQIEARPNGGRPNIQSWSKPTPPEGFVLIPDDMDVQAFYDYRGFVNIEHDGVYLTKIEGNQEAFDEYIKEYPDPDPAIEQKKARIAELKQLLADTDYKAIKYAEGEISEEEYAEVKAQRQAWRDEINQLEAEIGL